MVTFPPSRALYGTLEVASGQRVQAYECHPKAAVTSSTTFGRRVRRHYRGGDNGLARGITAQTQGGFRPQTTKWPEQVDGYLLWGSGTGAHVACGGTFGLKCPSICA